MTIYLTGRQAVRVLVVEDIRLHRENLVASLTDENCVTEVAGVPGGHEGRGGDQPGLHFGIPLRESLDSSRRDRRRPEIEPLELQK